MLTEGTLEGEIKAFMTDKAGYKKQKLLRDLWARYSGHVYALLGFSWVSARLQVLNSLSTTNINLAWIQNTTHDDIDEVGWIPKDGRNSDRLKTSNTVGELFKMVRLRQTTVDFIVSLDKRIEKLVAKPVLKHFERNAEGDKLRSAQRDHLRELDRAKNELILKQAQVESYNTKIEELHNFDVTLYKKWIANRSARGASPTMLNDISQDFWLAIFDAFKNKRFEQLSQLLFVYFFSPI